MKSLNEMEELKRFQGSTFDEFSRKRLIENRHTILELTAKIQELQNEVYCMNDSRDFKDAESVRPVNLRYSHFIVILEGCRAAKISRQTCWDAHGKSGNVFVNPPASSSSLDPGGFNPWIPSVTEHISLHVTS